MLDLLQHAATLHRSGNLAGAAGGYRSVLAQEPDNADALHLLGVITTQKGDLQEGVALISRAIDLSPDRAHFYDSLANAYRAGGRLGEAVDAAQQATKLDPHYTAAWITFGIVRHQEKQYEQAIALFEKALESNPQSVDANNNMGITYRHKGELGKAVECFRKAVDLEPSHGGAHNNLGLALLEYEAYLTELLNDSVTSYQRALTTLQRGDMENDLRFLHQRMIPRWHFSMLNDKGRNEAYDRALRTLVKPGDLVLDIGAGSGLLAMMAVRAGAGHVVSCEMIKPLADKAVEIVARNGMSQQITVVAKKSTQLLVGGDLPERADLLVAEILM